MNQCDGCAAGMKLRDGLHTDKQGRPVMVCQKYKYVDTGACQCSMRTKLVGDGCQYCNPEVPRGDA